jgi:hypothetical protein
MKRAKLVVLAAFCLAVVGCADSTGITRPDVSLQAVVNGPVAVSGTYDAVVDFSTLRLTPRGANCLLQVDGQLVFSGTIEGTATGTTSALVLATCAQVATTPPGTFRDVFKSELEFEGTIDGVPAQASMIYQGRVQEGGVIEGRIILSNGAAGVLDVDARVAVGGSYTGAVVVH